MSPLSVEGVFGFLGVAANQNVDPAVLVIVGQAGNVLYSNGVEDDEETGLEVYTFVQAPRFTYGNLNGVDFGGGRFVACGDAGAIGYSSQGDTWSPTVSGIDESLQDVCFVGSGVWVAVGAGGKIIRSTDNGISWAEVASTVAVYLYAVASSGTNLVAVGESGTVIKSEDSGATWADSGHSGDDLHAVVYNNTLGKWIVMGDETAIFRYTLATDAFETGSCNVDVDLRGVAFAGGDGIMIAAGSGGQTVTSTTGLSWVDQESGVTSDFLYAVEYLDARFISVGSDGKISYSATGAGVRAYDKFKPISDIYRAVAFARFGGYMLYAGMWEFIDGNWEYFPRRIRNPSPGTVNDFDEDFGAYFSDLPGDGAIIAAASIEGGIILGEQNQISLLTDGGSVLTPWDYHDNYGEGLQLISNLTTFGGAAFGICTDGLIYRADYNSVTRLQSFFDLTKFDDFNPGSERVTIQFDPATQKLIVFRPESPWTLYLCDDETGGVTEFALPEFFDGHTSWSPRSVFVSQGEITGIKVGYGTDDEEMDTVITLDLQLHSGISGNDIVNVGPGGLPFAGEVVTGCFRMTQLGVRGDVREILVRTNVDPEGDILPRLAIGIKSEPEDDWSYSPDVAGTIEVDGGAGTAAGTGTAFSNMIAYGDDVSTDFEIPWLVEKITRAYTRNVGTEVITNTSYTKIGAREIQLPAPLASTDQLFVYAIGAPQVYAQVGDLLELDDGSFRKISDVVSALVLQVDNVPADYLDAATYIPTKEIPAGDSYGDGKVIFGIGKGFDQIMLRFIMVPGIPGEGNTYPKFAKIKKIEIGYEPTGPELKTDS